MAEGEAVVSADRSAVWEILTDPEALPELTPFLNEITADGDLWRWQMGRIPVLGVSVAPAFTEKMTFTPEERIEFTHAPPDGKPERAAVAARVAAGFSLGAFASRALAAQRTKCFRKTPGRTRTGAAPSRRREDWGVLSFAYLS